VACASLKPGDIAATEVGPRRFINIADIHRRMTVCQQEASSLSD
jgi:hypothetical protein